MATNKRGSGAKASSSKKKRAKVLSKASHAANSRSFSTKGDTAMKLMKTAKKKEATAKKLRSKGDKTYAPKLEKGAKSNRTSARKVAVNRAIAKSIGKVQKKNNAQGRPKGGGQSKRKKR